MNRVYLYKIDKAKMRSEEEALIDSLPKWRKEKAEAIRNEEVRFQSIAAGHLLEYAVRDYIYNEHPGVRAEHLEVKNEHQGIKNEYLGTEDEHSGIKYEQLVIKNEHLGILEITRVCDLKKEVYPSGRYDIQFMYEPDIFRVRIYKNSDDHTSTASEDKIKSKIVSNIIYFSISHSGEYVAAAISDKSIGVDIEQKDDKDFKITNRMFTPEEIAYIGNDQRRFRDVWTTKEAFLKCTKEGLSVPLNSFMAEGRYIVSRGYNLNSKKYYVSTGRYDDDKYSITIVENIG